MYILVEFPGLYRDIKCGRYCSQCVFTRDINVITAVYFTLGCFIEHVVNKDKHQGTVYKLQDKSIRCGTLSLCLITLMNYWRHEKNNSNYANMPPTPPVLGIEPRAMYMLGKHSTTLNYVLRPYFIFLNPRLVMIWIQ